MGKIQEITNRKKQISNKKQTQKTNFQTETQLFGILILMIRIYLGFVVLNLSLFRVRVCNEIKYLESMK